MDNRQNEKAPQKNYAYTFNNDEERDFIASLGESVNTGSRKKVVEHLRKVQTDHWGVTDEEASKAFVLPSWVTDEELQGKGGDPEGFTNAFILAVPREAIRTELPEHEILKKLGSGVWKGNYDKTGIIKIGTMTP